MKNSENKIIEFVDKIVSLKRRKPKIDVDKHAFTSSSTTKSSAPLVNHNVSTNNNFSEGEKKPLKDYEPRSFSHSVTTSKSVHILKNQNLKPHESSKPVKARPFSYMLLGLLLTLSMNTTTGCTASSQTPQITQPVMQPMAYRDPPPQYNNPGSIYNSNTYRSLYEDGRARRVGDIVTINIMETSSANQAASTETDRTSEVGGGVSSLFGLTNIFGIPIGADMVGISGASNSKGEGTTTRNSSIHATLSGRVINVLSNGNLELEAVREIKVNNETQFMVVTGLVRSRDITPSNTISSTQLANAKIEYYGQGVLSAKEKPGWLVRLVDAISPF